MKWDTDDSIAVGFLIALTAVWIFFLVSCGGPNQAYLQNNWPRFQEECVTYCDLEEAHPSRDLRPWVCGCADFLDDE